MPSRVHVIMSQHNDWSNVSKMTFVYVVDEYYVTMNVQRDHGHQQGQQDRQRQRDPKGKRERKNQIKSEVICTVSSQIIYFFNTFFKISRKGAYRLSTVTSLARGAGTSGGSRSTRGSGGSSLTSLTTVSL